MELRLTRLEGRVDRLCEDTEKQDRDIKTLAELTTTIEVLITEMKYMRKDLSAIQGENLTIAKELKDYQFNQQKGRLSNYDGYKRQMIGWGLIYALGILTTYFIK